MVSGKFFDYSVKGIFLGILCALMFGVAYAAANQEEEVYDTPLRMEGELPNEPVYTRRNSLFKSGRYTKLRGRIIREIPARNNAPAMLLGSHHVFDAQTLKPLDMPQWVAHGRMVYEGGGRWTHRRVLPPLDEERSEWTLTITDPDTGEELHHGALPELPAGFEYFKSPGRYSAESLPQSHIAYVDLTGNGMKDIILLVRHEYLANQFMFIAWEMTPEGPGRQLWRNSVYYPTHFPFQVYETGDVTGDGVEDMFVRIMLYVGLIEGATGRVLWKDKSVRWNHVGAVAIRTAGKQPEIFLAVSRRRGEGGEIGLIRALSLNDGEVTERSLGIGFWRVEDMAFANMFGEPEDTLVISKRERNTGSIELVDPESGKTLERLEGLPLADVHPGPEERNLFLMDANQDGSLGIIKSYFNGYTYVFYLGEETATEN